MELWRDATADLLTRTAEWTNRVEVADLDGDGWVDLLFANGGDYSTPGEPEPNRVFLNRGAGRPFEEAKDLLGGQGDFARVIKVRDLNADGHPDIVVGTTFESRCRLYLGEGGGRFLEVSDSHLPRRRVSVGDLEIGDVDADGHLDLVLVDWGAGDSMVNEGGGVLLWRGDGTGHFGDETWSRVPITRFGFSWDLELLDADNDWDLDIAVSCKRCEASRLMRNDGRGYFVLDRRALPAFTNNYDLEPMDLDGDGDLDLVTINDGEIVGGVAHHRRQHVFLNDGAGMFQDATEVLWPDAENPGEDDNMVAFLDYDSDGDADFLLASLTGADRLLINDGSGALRQAPAVLSGDPTPGTLHLALADLDGDRRLDVVMAQGEHPTAVEERIFLGSGLAPDTAAPHLRVAPPELLGEGRWRVRARAHDSKSPSRAHDWKSVELRWREDDRDSVLPMTWYGEYLWRATAELGPQPGSDLEICAEDAAGNRSCVRLEPPA